LPDLTLIRRADLLDAAQAGLIYPLESKVASAILGDLYDVALQLGQVDGQLYGLPYLLDAQHTAHKPFEDDQTSPASFDELLAAQHSFVFPAAEANGINSVFLMQYLAAGGTLPVDNVVTINESALLRTLTFYEHAVAEGIIDESVLNYTMPAEYQADLLSGGIDIGLVTSKSYLDLTQAGENLVFGSIPTESGQIGRQAQYSQTVNFLPSQRSALKEWGSSDYIDFADTLLTNATTPLSDNAGGTATRAMQGALASVLLGQSNAEQAMQVVINQVNES
jgi:hypothetical protein